MIGPKAAATSAWASRPTANFSSLAAPERSEPHPYPRPSPGPQHLNTRERMHRRDTTMLDMALGPSVSGARIDHYTMCPPSQTDHRLR